MKSPSRRSRVVIIGLAGVVGAVGGALLGFYIAQTFMEPASFGDNIVARLFEFMADLVIAGGAAAAGAVLGWLLGPPSVRALLRWPGQGRSFALQLMGGLVLWPVVVLIALLTVDIPSGLTLALVLLFVFAVSAFTEGVATSRPTRPS